MADQSSARTSNPAKRLLRVVERYRKLPQAVQAGDGLQGWRELLDLPRNVYDKPKTAHCAMLVLDLPNKIGIAIKKINDIDHARYLSWQVQLQSRFDNYNFSSPISQYFSPIDENVLSLIHICDDQLSRFAQEQLIPDDVMASLLEQVKLCGDMAKEIEGDEFLKSFILKHLLTIEQSLIDYKLQGISAIQESTERVCGAIALNGRMREHIQHSAVGKKLWSIVCATVAAVNVVQASLQLVEWTSDIRLLLSSSGGHDAPTSDCN